MKNLLYLFSTVFFLITVSCTTDNLNEDIKAIDKGLVESPGGQSSNQQSRIDKNLVESPGGQSEK